MDLSWFPGLVVHFLGDSGGCFQALVAVPPMAMCKTLWKCAHYSQWSFNFKFKSHVHKNINSWKWWSCCNAIVHFATQHLLESLMSSWQWTETRCTSAPQPSRLKITTWASVASIDI
jgi:hypothetical protein